MSFVTKEYLRDLNLLEKDEIIVGIILTLSAGVITAVIYYFSFSVTTLKEEDKKTIKPVVAQPKVSVEPSVVPVEAAATSALLKSQEHVVSMATPFLADYEATTASVLLTAHNYIASLPKAVDPFLASYEATTASNLLESQKYIDSIPTPVEPFLADYEATTASSLLTASEYISSMPKPPSPFLAKYEITTAANLLEASEYISNLPKPVKPFLANYEATSASVLLKATEYIENLPKPVEPFLADYEATTASGLLKANEYISNLPKPVEPFLAHYEATAASNLLEAGEYINNLPKPSTPFLAHYEATTACSLLDANEYINNLPKPVEPFLANYEATTANSLLEAQEYINSLSQTSLNRSSFSVSASPFQPSKDFIPSSPQVMLFSDPDSPADSEPETVVDDGSVFVMANNSFIPYDEKAWARAEKIQKQSQNHFPKMKSRCNYWPNCTNKHCKYWHPVKDCRMGDECTFAERCMFLHPSDYGLSHRKKKPHKQTKRTVSNVF
ncbi:hypothetical protein G6F46_008796 [Rhizopus delemar]|uniref:C3H1-type domain-containing protein n=2 Tax=Rhizopus TaxID=4842 RepID=A0A9P6YYQ8_9FUNG|nr:hypothetical protein G6F52_009354 [Rhizopus delemar]KAG1539612.1 hypothetical protein G6F51_009034 [Rhizopus arrhizus]KAG1551766.1 hypothetical protein G6F49_008890 [Rhizopus delemar]KAG1566938.1 hypothetical protein G6F50_008670 [Rhizopus delemar]KAG1579011.1 hypothetical protein G6F48_011482 [Rhizopus delemar]